MESELWSTIRRLAEVEKLSGSAIARRLGVHRQTVKRALGSAEGPPVDLPRRAEGPSKLGGYEGYLRERFQAYPELTAQKLFLEIQRQGYAGSYTTVKRYLFPLRRSPKVFLRLETMAGDYAQVDWANVGTLEVGNARRKLSCFVMVLSYSRMMYLEFTLSQKLEDFLACHVNAFAFFGGVPRRINYDNLKTVVLSRVGADIRFNPRFMDFAGYYLFEPIPCNVRAGWEKGKVERSIGYVRTAFLAGRAATSWAVLEKDARLWRDGQANVRVHGTTRQRPVDRWVVEKPLLHALPPTPYDTSIVESAQSSRQGLIHFDGNRYTVPWRAASKILTLKASAHELVIYEGTQEKARHGRCYEKHRIIENPAHSEGLLAEKKRARAAKTQEYLARVSPVGADYLQGLVQSELHVPSHLEKIRELIRLYGQTEVAGAMEHALRFQAFGADTLQRIISQKRAARNMAEPQPILLAKKPDWNRMAVEQTDLSVYDELFKDLP